MGMLGWIVIAIVVLVAVYAVAVYNRLVRLRALAREGFSGITVQLRRRADLVPNLVSTVKGYATHERETLDQVIAHRTDAVSAKGVEATAQADNTMSAMLGRLIAVAEAYPDLKADENFRQLQDELSGHRGRIAGRAALLQRHRARPQHARPLLPRHAVRRAARLRRGALLPGRGCGDPDRAEGRIREAGVRPMIRAAFALLLAGGAAAADARRRPTSASSAIDSDVAVQRDGALLVAETITVRAEGIEIRRGIYRDFPTRYKGRRGGQVRVGFELLGVTKNGAPEPAATETIGNGVRIRIGQRGGLPRAGDYRYVIRYRTTRQLGRFDDFDELYWNVTGNGWAFPIDQAEVRITLPSPATFGQRAFYTGPQGATGQQAG